MRKKRAELKPERGERAVAESRSISFSRTKGRASQLGGRGGPPFNKSIKRSVILPKGGGAYRKNAFIERAKVANNKTLETHKERKQNPGVNESLSGVGVGVKRMCATKTAMKGQGWIGERQQRESFPTSPPPTFFASRKAIPGNGGIQPSL